MTTEHYGDAFRDMQKAEKVAAALIQAALESGAKPRGLNVSNALEKVLRELRDYHALVTQANELGSTLPNILKSYRMTKRAEVLLPAAFKVAPEHWATDTKLERQEGWVNGKRVEKLYKGRGVTPLTAQNRCKRLQPILIMLFQQYQDAGFSEFENYVKSIEIAYNTSPYEEFVAEVFNELRELSQGEILTDELESLVTC